MAQGQGARSALPIHGLFYQKIYADPNLNIKNNGSFDIPENFDPCQRTELQSFEYEEVQKVQPKIGIDDMFD